MFLRKIIVAGLVASALGAVFAIGFLWGNKTKEFPVPGLPFSETLLEPETFNVERGTLHLEHETLIVSRVIDGDTVELSSGERVRIIGIDAPEHDECFFEESKTMLEQLVLGKDVRAQQETNDRDRYGRLLRHLYVGDTFIDLTLVEEGFAAAYPYPPDTAYAAEFSDAETQAKAHGRGLWSSCASFKNVEQFNSEPSVEGCVVKGNISSSGEKIYHLPGCGSYGKTNIDESKGERWFCSEQEAQSAGWRKAGNCS